MFSNRYIFIYSTVMVIIVAAVLSSAAMFLQPRQERNMRIAKIQGILAALNIQANAENAEQIYDQTIKSEIAINQDGEVVSLFQEGMMLEGDLRPFDVDLKKELYNKRMGEPFLSVLYMADIEGQTVHIIPLRGTGLWGPLYGNIALGPDFNEIVGADFTHDKETPGLGAEIAYKEFSDQFIGKTIFDEAGNFVSVLVVKGGAATLSPDMQIHGVDAISGGTITSNGVTDMLRNCLENYVEYAKNNI